MQRPTTLERNLEQSRGVSEPRGSAAAATSKAPPGTEALLPTPRAPHDGAPPAHSPGTHPRPTRGPGSCAPRPPRSPAPRPPPGNTPGPAALPPGPGRAPTAPRHSWRPGGAADSGRETRAPTAPAPALAPAQSATGGLARGDPRGAGCPPRACFFTFGVGEKAPRGCFLKRSWTSRRRFFDKRIEKYNRVDRGMRGVWERRALQEGRSLGRPERR